MEPFTKCKHAKKMKLTIGWICPACGETNVTIGGIPITGTFNPYIIIAENIEDDCAHMTTISIPGGLASAKLCVTCGKLILTIGRYPIIIKLYEVDEVHRAIIDKIGEWSARGPERGPQR